MCQQYLKSAFNDPDRRLKARDELKVLKLPYLRSFNGFYSEFVRLANAGGLGKQQWKEEMHNRLYPEL